MYLFYRIEKELDGSLMSIFLDEGWQYLDNKYWREKLKTWLPTLRKANCHIVLATQSPKSVVESSISHTIMDNCATQIFFANPLAERDVYISKLSLTEAEFDCVRNLNVRSRFFVYKQGESSSLCRFDLSNMAEIVKVFSATKESVIKVDSLVKKHPHKWLDKFMSDEVVG